MPQFLNTADAEFEEQFVAVLGAKREDAQDVQEAVSTILTDVRRRGDDAVIEYTHKFDRFELSTDTMRIGEEEISNARARCPEEVTEALQLAHGRIEDYHKRQVSDG